MSVPPRAKAGMARALKLICWQRSMPSPSSALQKQPARRRYTCNYVPKIGDTTAPRDLQEAADYYLTPRGQHPNSTNQMLMTSISTLASFTGFEGADTFITQPLLMVAGSEAGSLWHSQELNAKAASKAKELLSSTVPRTWTCTMVTVRTYAAKKLVPFFQSNL